MRTIPIYNSGKGQVVCLPTDLAYEGVEELAIFRDGDVITLRPVRPSWASFLELPKADEEFLGNRNIWLICQVHRGSILLHTGRTDCLKGFPLANIPSVRYCSFFLTRKIKYE